MTGAGTQFALACALAAVFATASTQAALLRDVLPWSSPCNEEPLRSSGACDPSASPDERAAALVAMLSDGEAAALLSNGAGAVPRLHIPRYQWWGEALHGVGRGAGGTFRGTTPVATSFPQVVTTSASFNASLFRAIGEATAVEARAFSNQHHAGLTFWAPNVNVFRDPRWGRGQETPGEDPVLNADYAASFVSGMQGDGGVQGGGGGGYMRASACCKHFAAYSLESWGGVTRHSFDAAVSRADLNDTYLPAFQSCVQRGRVSGIMCSYNAINGVPACADSSLLTDLLRGKWGFDGYVTSDCGAVTDVWQSHRYTSTADDTALAVLAAGMDIECGSFFSDGNLAACLSGGRCSRQEVLDPRLRKLLAVQIRLGMWDPPDRQPYQSIGPEAVDTPRHRALALEAARQGLVLLKNRGAKLPLPLLGAEPHANAPSRVAVIGPNANATETMQGNYQGVAPFLVSPLAGIRAYAPQAQFAPGCVDGVACESEAGFAVAVAAAAAADEVVLVMGLRTCTGSEHARSPVYCESEGVDRTHLSLPGRQQELVAAVAAAAARPITLVIMAGGSVDLAAAKANPAVGAILFAGYPGQAGGRAIADTLFGTSNPSGRLTQTFYPASFASEVSMFDMGMRPDSASGNPGRGYRFYTGTPVYPFGSGLSYTSFRYGFASQPLVSSAREPLAEAATVHAAAEATHHDLGRAALNAPVATYRVAVRNTGARAGAETVLVYVHPPKELAGARGAPRKWLALHQRVLLQAGELRTLELAIQPQHLRYPAGGNGAMVTPPGTWLVQIGQDAQLTHELVLGASREGGKAERAERPGAARQVQ